jgi:hypothetical protein
MFLTAVLVYAAFWNPRLDASMAWNFLDAGVSLVDTGRWMMAHSELYERVDTAAAAGGLVTGEPPGMAILAMPVYLAWRAAVGPVVTRQDFAAFNAACALLLGATLAALVATQVLAYSQWVGAGRRGRLLAAALVAFGTANFFLGTTFFKESVAALGVLLSVRLAVERRPVLARAGAGAIAAAATVVAHPVGLLVPLLAAMILRREGVRRALAFALGAAPLVAALAAYNTWLFGRPWRSGYLALTAVEHPGFVWPKLRVLLELLVGTEGGLVLYSPFLLVAVAGLALAWRGGHRAEAVVAVALLMGSWLAAAAWISQFSDVASWAHTLGPRMLFPAVPLLAAFTGPTLDRLGHRALAALAVPSVSFGYLGAQAGFIPTQTDSTSLAYALKTFVSGTGMGVFFKEWLPARLGLDTVHTVLTRPEVTARDLPALLATATGLRLMVNQAVFLALDVAALTLVAVIVTAVWKGRLPLAADERLPCAS